MSQPYGIIETGGKQYRVQEGDIIDCELLKSDGKEIEFQNILFFHDGNHQKIAPGDLKNAHIKGEILGQIRGPKVVSFKYKKRKNYRKKIGHRQNYSRVKITGLSV